MKKEKIFLPTLFCFAFIFSLIAPISPPAKASPATIYVPDDYPTIRAAVNAASPGDTIIVRDGIYTENVDVNKDHLTIKSENGAEKTIVQAANSDDHVFEIMADYVNISGFTVKGSTGYPYSGIYLYKVKHCEISDNHVLSNLNGIQLHLSNNNIISANKVSNNDYGIFLGGRVWLGEGGDNNIITNNLCESNNRGVFLDYYSKNNTLTGNICRKNDYGFFLAGGNNIIRNNTCQDNTWGILLYYSIGNTLTNNILSNNEKGIAIFNWMKGFNITISDISRNTVLNNMFGIYLCSAGGTNYIYLNNFSGNARNFETGSCWSSWPPSKIIWYSPEETTYAYNGSTYTNYLGNYWDDYTGSDADGDGIGDTPYPIDSDNDNYPLIEPFENYGMGPAVTSISQYQSDGTQVPEGGIIPEGTIVFKAILEDADGDDVRLEIELRKIDEPFTGEPTPETISDFVPSGSEVTITRSGLVDGEYHWQYRVKDSKGAVSEWKEFGEAGNVDFKIRSLLSKYAPVLYLYFDDFRPRSIESMLDNAGLWKWNNLANVLIGNCAEYVIQGPVQVNQLLKHNRGNYFLDLWWAQNEDVCGGTTTPNVGSFWEKYKKVVYGRYYEPPGYHSIIVLQYWFFYVYNNWRDYGGLNNHEGDWEMVQVILDKKTKKPTYVTYSHHVLNDHTTVEWKNVSKIGTHPEVFVARGSHASYPSPGVHCVLGETKIGNKVISLCDILRDKYRRKLQDQTTGVETVLYPERDYKIICLNNYSWPTWEGWWGKRVKELKNGTCLRSGKCGPLSPGKQERKWNHPLEWALFSVPTVVAVVTSPVHLHVYDQRGNHVGLTPEGLIEADIPGTLAHYSLGDEGELVAISTAEPLIYKIKGYEKGTFDFVLYKFLEENKVVMVSYKEVPVDENTTAILNSTSDNPNFLVDIDVNNDGEADYQLRPDSVIGVTGDLDHDGDIDRNDLNVILSYRNQEASQCPECDLDNDGVITVLDARKLVLMCTRPRCEIEVIE